MKKNIQVFLVDDHEVAREGLKRMLELEQDIDVVGEAAGAEEALGKLGSISPGDSVLQAQPVPAQEWFNNDATRYQWDVELVVEPPVDVAILLRFCGWLKTTINAEIEELAGSRDGDTISKLRLSPNPPMRSGLGVRTRGEGRGTRRSALDSDKWGRWRPLVVVGGADGGPGQRRWGGVGGTVCRGRQSRTGPVRLCGAVG